jgi:hypothetical protein
LKRGALPFWFLRFAGLANAVQSVAAFRRAIQPALEEVRDTLVQRGLAPSREVIAQLGRNTCMIFAIPLILGSIKMVVGLERGRPVGILFFLLLFTAASMLVSAGISPFRTRAGRAAAADARRVQARAARAPEDSELVLAFALSGVAVRPAAPARHCWCPEAGQAAAGQATVVKAVAVAGVAAAAVADRPALTSRFIFPVLIFVAGNSHVYAAKYQIHFRQRCRCATA